MVQLNRTHGEPLAPAELARLRELLGGHPYLARKALYEVAPPQPHMTPERLFETATTDDGPFRDHLRRFLIVFQKKEMHEVLGAFREIVKERGCSDQNLVYRLESAGLIKREQRKVVPSCRLYLEYFRDRL